MSTDEKRLINGSYDSLGETNGKDDGYFEEAEKSVLRKLDRRLLPWLAFLYFLSYLDRSNIGNVHDPLLEDLDLTEEQYSLAVSIFYVGYILFEVPCNLVLKKVNPAYWIGSMAVAWGICSTSMAFVQDYQGLLAIRVFLGIAESGFFPGVVYYLSRWYKPEEQSFRVAMFYCASAIAGVASGLLASAFLQIDEFLGLENWRWLFLCEGVPSIICGVLTWYILPSKPEKISALSDLEKSVSSERLYHLKNEVDARKINNEQVWRTLFSPKVWAFSLLFLSLAVPGYAKSFYAPSIISEMGYTTVEANLLSSLLALVGFFFILINGYHADKVRERPWHILIPMFLGLIGFASLTVTTYYYMPKLSYATMFLCAFQGCCLPVIISWMNSSLKTSTEIATATAVLISTGNLGGIIGPMVYGYLYVEPLEGETEGSYARAHGSMCLFFVVGLLIGIGLKFLVPSQYKDDPRTVKITNAVEDERKALLGKSEIN